MVNKSWMAGPQEVGTSRLLLYIDTKELQSDGHFIELFLFDPLKRNQC